MTCSNFHTRLTTAEQISKYPLNSLSRKCRYSAACLPATS